MFYSEFLALGALTVSLLAFSLPTFAQTQTTANGVRNVVLVHGAFADGSSWAKVIPLLQARG
ncbi:lipase family protein [Hymenobacter terricola]|uniref:hypothetical protein n=1 Tax=Hymenobacter terricola TaxID=2819236 RepID=UPI00293D2F70|nr:hypothetical protein [Hymenobacter terricola]